MTNTPFEPGQRIPLCVPQVDGSELEYVREALETGWVSSAGPFVELFEKAVIARVGAAHGVATVNGTAALHLALLVAGVQAYDEVLVSSLSFIAPANAIRYCGAWPVFMDAEPNFWQMDADKLADFLRNHCSMHSGGLHNRRTGRRIRAVIPVHMLGHPVAIEEILNLASEYDLPVVEDAAESLGAQISLEDGSRQAIGSAGDIACFSFNGNKIVTAGGGGMIVTNSDRWAQRARHLSTQARSDAVEGAHDQVGYNYRLTNLQAAVGLAQLKRLDAFVERKRHIAEEYRQAFIPIDGIVCMDEANWAYSTHWLFTILIDEQVTGVSSREMMRHLDSLGIESRPLWQPLHLSAAFRGAQAHRCEVAERLHAQGLSLPCSVGITREQQKRVIDAVVNRLGAANGQIDR